MELIEELLNNTFYHRVTKKYSSSARRMSNILLPLTLFCFAMFIALIALNNQFLAGGIFFLAFLVFLLLLTFLHDKEKIRIIEGSPDIASIIIKKAKWYSFETYDIAKFNKIMKGLTSNCLRDGNGTIVMSLVEMLIVELKETNERFVKKYVAFGVILAFLVNPMYGIYSQKYVNLAFSFPPVLGMVMHVFGIFFVLYITYFLVNTKEVYLGFTKDYYSRLRLIEQLYNIKADNLLNSKRTPANT
ncbi:hypothetical protein [Pedobacter cryoconitis]|uniref:hypothetical protein n=1 Tax=Pedobacter cryoconitis TaxID=188932 RepID=UPI001615FBCC|nr:hypothetical protein [Pedobacter cryoconitis]MBB5644885.1 membrane-associated HD superfamily phosphohydrolase [Pedobacter cryoconitis]